MHLITKALIIDPHSLINIQIYTLFKIYNNLNTNN